jgi:hypothetical protein
MNIFILDDSIDRSVKYLCDKHVVKMTLETTQLLCSPYEPDTAPYRRAHYNHPCAKWTRASEQNYEWLLDYGYHIAQEYTHRYGKVHKSLDVIDWCDNSYHRLLLPNTERTPFPQAMPEQYKCDDAVDAYRYYYLGEKVDFCKWTNRDQPKWFKEALHESVV